MQWLNTRNNYGFVLRFLHALIFILIVLQLIIGIFMDDIPKSYQGYVYTFHKSLGVVIFFVAIIFVIWRLFNVKPRWPENMWTLERVAAHTVHFLIYCLIILMPLSGWIMSTAAGKPPNFFWLGELPLPGIPVNEAISDWGAKLHYIFAWILGILVLIHILAAFWHYFVRRDNVMQRIWHS